MLVSAARRIRPERWNTHAVFAFHRLCVPSARRAVNFRRHPALDVPAIYGWRFRLLPQLDDFAQQRTRRGIVLLEFSADPRAAGPAPHRPVVCCAEPIDPTR